MSTLKKELYNLCRVFVEERIARAQENILQLQQSANEETKSSAGDKYETGRAMAQLEMEKSGMLLGEAQRMQQSLSQIDPDQETNNARSGSIVITDQGNYFISIGAGILTLESGTYYAISPASPIAKAMWGISSGRYFTFNKKNYQVQRIL